MNIIKSLTYQEKRSTFLALLLKFDSQKEAEDVLKELQLEHKDARHILRALRVKNQYGVYITEASDDKEPIASMKKVRDLMERKDIRDVGVYLIRYYGGTKLGASHLDHVYFTLAMKLLEK